MTERQLEQNATPLARTPLITNERVNVGLLAKLGIPVPQTYPYGRGYLTFLGYLGFGEATDGCKHEELVGKRFDEALRSGKSHVVALKCDPPVAYGEIITTAPYSVTCLEAAWVERRIQSIKHSSIVSRLTGETLPPAFS